MKSKKVTKVDIKRVEKYRARLQHDIDIANKYNVTVNGDKGKNNVDLTKTMMKQLNLNSDLTVNDVLNKATTKAFEKSFKSFEDKLTKAIIKSNESAGVQAWDFLIKSGSKIVKGFKAIKALLQGKADISDVTTPASNAEMTSQVKSNILTQDAGAAIVNNVKTAAASAKNRPAFSSYDTATIEKVEGIIGDLSTSARGQALDLLDRNVTIAKQSTEAYHAYAERLLQNMTLLEEQVKVYNHYDGMSEEQCEAIFKTIARIINPNKLIYDKPAFNGIGSIEIQYNAIDDESIEEINTIEDIMRLLNN